MATTDTKQGFRLPWSSDRSQDDSRAEESTAVTDEAATAAAAADPAAAVNPDGSEGAEEAWPEIDVNARLNLISADPSAAQSSGTHIRTDKEHVAMVDSIRTVAPDPAAPRKPSKLIADLAAAMRSTAEAAREQALTQVEAESRQVVEAIRSQSTDGHAALRSRCDEDIAAIRDWSKAEIARVREETERRISERKATLEAEMASHSGAIERRVEDVQESVAAYETRMTTFFEHLLQESDPARLAAMAESMPEPPSLEIWADLPEPDVTVEATATAETVDAVVETTPEPEIEPAATAGVVADATGWGTDAIAPVEAPAPAETAATTEAADAAPVPQAAVAASEPATVAEPVARTADSWGDTDNAWSTNRGASWPAADARPDHADPAWSNAAETAADPATRETIMAAIEADAETGAAAEAGSETEPGSGMLADDGSSEVVEEPSSDAEASLAARLASLLPGRDSTEGDDGATAEPMTTQVVVTGLVSVASIASFKRHLGRLTGVQSVSVASGPDGEFMFNVTHRADVSFRDVIPTMPGFAARVTGGGDGVVNVTARDPEAEG